MKGTLVVTNVLVLAAGLAAACSSSNIPAGSDSLALDGTFTTGWACACPNGATSCGLACPDGTKGSCIDGQPYCDVQAADAGLACACPSGETSCSITCPDGTAGQCTNGVPTCGGTGGGNCCPVGWDLYSCTFPDGGAGEACHNPELGCASSTTCGQGCDPVVTGRCGGSGSDACPGLGCFPNCPNGVLKDQNGCDTCQCAPTDGGNLQWYTTCGYP